jgi:hypothetical protein
MAGTGGHVFSSMSRADFRLVDKVSEKEGCMSVFKGMAIRVLIKATLLGGIILLALYLVEIEFFK